MGAEKALRNERANDATAALDPKQANQLDPVAGAGALNESKGWQKLDGGADQKKDAAPASGGPTVEEMRESNTKKINFWMSRALTVISMVSNYDGAKADLEGPTLYDEGELKPQFLAFDAASREIRGVVLEAVRARGYLRNGDKDLANAALGITDPQQYSDPEYLKQPDTIAFLANSSARVHLAKAEALGYADLSGFRGEVDRLTSGDTRSASEAGYETDIAATLTKLARIGEWNAQYHGWTRAGPVYNAFIEKCERAEKNLIAARAGGNPGEIKRLLDEAHEALRQFKPGVDPIALLDAARKDDKKGFEFIEDYSSVLPGVGIVFNVAINQVDSTLEWLGGQITNAQYAFQTAGNIANGLLSKFPAKGFVKDAMVGFGIAFATEMNKHVDELEHEFAESKNLDPAKRAQKISNAILDAVSKAFVEALTHTVENAIEKRLGGTKFAEDYGEDVIAALKLLGKAANKLGLLHSVHEKIEEIKDRTEAEIKKSEAKESVK